MISDFFLNSFRKLNQICRNWTLKRQFQIYDTRNGVASYFLLWKKLIVRQVQKQETVAVVVKQS